MALSGSRVLMENGTLRRCDSIRPGDRVFGGSRVRCIVRTLSHNMKIARIGEQRGHEERGFAEWQPVHIGKRWTFPGILEIPKKLAEPTYFYSFVLEGNGHLLFIDNILTCSIAHSYRTDILRHPYFGAREEGMRNVLDDLQLQPGWVTGVIDWGEVIGERNPETGLICRLTPLGSPSDSPVEDPQPLTIRATPIRRRIRIVRAYPTELPPPQTHFLEECCIWLLTFVAGWFIMTMMLEMMLGVRRGG